MKTQIRFQRILYICTLVVAALAIVCALAFCTGAIARIGGYQNMKGNEIRPIFGGTDTDEYYNFLEVLDVYDMAQSYTYILLGLGIAFILLVVVCYAFANNSRRNYYKSNYITSIILAAFAIVWAVLLVIFSLQTQTGVLSNDAWMVTFKEYAESNSAYYFSDSTWIYIFNYIVAVVAVVDAVALIYNCIWKRALMKGEKELLLNGKPAVEETVVAGEVA